MKTIFFDLTPLLHLLRLSNRPPSREELDATVADRRLLQAYRVDLEEALRLMRQAEGRLYQANRRHAKRLSRVIRRIQEDLDDINKIF